MKLKIKDPFLQKFEDRCEKIGEGGIFKVPLKFSVIKDDHRRNVQDSLMDSNKRQMSIISKMRNQYNALTFDDYQKIPTNNNNNKKNEYENEKIDNELNEYPVLSQNRNIFNNINNNNKNHQSIKLMNKSDNVHRLEKLKLRGINKNNKNNNSNKSFPKNQRYNNSIFNNDDSKPIKKNISLNERFYKPYSLKDYRSIMDNYKKDKFGGLGINMNNDWIKRQRLYNKVKNFENSVFKNFNKKINEFNIRKIESPQKAEMMRIKQQIVNSKRFMAQKYGKGIVLNKIREKRRKEEEEYKFFLRYKDYMKNRSKKNIAKVYDNVINNKKENYQEKLLQLKSSLI